LPNETLELQPAAVAEEATPSARQQRTSGDRSFFTVLPLS
jgi:hypothetical protein